MEQTYTILVVDDEPINVLLLTKILEIRDYNVISAESGIEALQIMQQIKPDLVLLDLLMPGISGFEVLGQIKNSNDLKNVPVIIISALNDYKSKEKATLLGAIAFITKPVLQEYILAIVGNILIARDSKVG